MTNVQINDLGPSLTGPGQETLTHRGFGRLGNLTATLVILTAARVWALPVIL